MKKFPIDAPKRKAVKAFERLGFQIVREREHIAMLRNNPDGSSTPLTLPNHAVIKGSTLRRICTQSDIDREEVLDAYSKI